MQLELVESFASCRIQTQEVMLKRDDFSVVADANEKGAAVPVGKCGYRFHNYAFELPIQAVLLMIPA